ncbi:hypothetical protein [Salsuginibacillus kocurii]|uniref:hypothetical protein n=1 Tax=Salsuginibacillus kocurii TaxID=427078 RepID=UPI00036B9CCF|nr:hypothetical protein [Salsuginibacillus kocurii]
MKYLILLFIMTISVACSSEVTNDEGIEKLEDVDVVATVKGQEITLKDIRSLYFVEDEDVPKMVENFVEEEILVLEAKSLGIDVTEEVEMMESLFPLGESGNEEFFEAQADYLGITVEEYYDTYFKERIERDAYMNHLIDEVLDLQNYEVDDAELVDNEINDFINNLLEEYEEDIEIQL